jgi:FkbM family methyltransferase
MINAIKIFFMHLSDSAGPTHQLEIPNFPHVVKMKVHTTTDIHISSEIASLKIWEAEETQFIIDTVKPGSSFVDVGANIGYFTTIAAKLVGAKGQVSAFEPDSDNYQLLSENCRINECLNTSIYDVALSNYNSTGKLYINTENKGDHTIYPTEDIRTSTNITLVNGSDFVTKHKLSIDFLKVDTQGSEFQVISGLREAIAQNLPKLVMLLELSPNSMKIAGHSGKELLEILNFFNGYFYVLDKHHHGLIAISSLHLQQWVNLTEMDSTSEGFINLVFSGVPIQELSNSSVIYDLGMYDNALEYLMAECLPPWNGQTCLPLDMENSLYFARGWSFPETWGVWSDGEESVIKFFIGSDLKKLTDPSLNITGIYFKAVAQEETTVLLNGLNLGSYNLQDCSIKLTNQQLQQEHLTITLLHNQPITPEKSDPRRIKFGLNSVSIS